MPLKDYILELFNEANLSELLTIEYKENIYSLSNMLIKITVIILIIFILLYIIVQNISESSEIEIKNKEINEIMHTKIQHSALNLNYGIHRDCLYNQLYYTYNNKITCCNNTKHVDIKENTSSNDNFALTDINFDNLKDSLQK